MADTTARALAIAARTYTDEQIKALASGFVFKGKVQSLSELPATETSGATYYVIDLTTFYTYMNGEWLKHEEANVWGSINGDIEDQHDLMALFEEHRQELLNEILRATSEEEFLQSQIDSESNRLDQEILRATSEENILHDLIDSESNRAIAKEDYLEDLINSEVSRATSEEAFLQEQIDSEAERLNSEILRAKLEELFLDEKIDSESIRAIAREDEIEANLNSEALRLDAKIDSESERAIVAEEYLKGKIVFIDSEMIDLREDLNSESQRAIQRENEIEDMIPEIKGIEPIEVSSEGDISLKYDQTTLIVTSEGELKVIGGGSSEGGVNFEPGRGLELVETSEGGKILQFTNAEDAKAIWFGTSEEYAALGSELDPYIIYIVDEPNDPLVQTTTYNRLVDKPQINGITLSGNKSLSSLGIQPTLNGTGGISVAGNEVSIKVNDNQFYFDNNNKLCIDEVDESFDPFHMIIFRTGFVGIISGTKCTKFKDGLYLGCLKFMNNDVVPVGDVTIGAHFGDDNFLFDGFCIGFDEANHVPIVFEAINGDLHMYVTQEIPARRYISLPFTFAAEVI